MGEHVGGYDEFTVDITDAAARADKRPDAKGQVPLAVLCDNSRNLEMIPSDLSDFNLYGGLYRHVNLVYVPAIARARAGRQHDRAGRSAGLGEGAPLQSAELAGRGAGGDRESPIPTGKVVHTSVQIAGAVDGRAGAGGLRGRRRRSSGRPTTPTLYQLHRHAARARTASSR